MLQLTVEDIFNRTYRQLRENNADPTHWSNDELFEYLNDMLVDIAEEVHCFKVSKGIEVNSGQRRYLVPSDILVPTRVEWDGEFLWPCSVEDLDRSDLDWRARDGDPKAWFVDIAPEGYVDLYRRPDTDGDESDFSSDYGVITDIDDGTNTYSFSSDYGVITAISSDGDQKFDFDDDYGVVTGYFSDSDNLVIHGYGYPSEISNLSDNLPRPIHGNHMLVTAYLIYRCFAKDGKGQDMEQAAVFRQQYYERRNKLRTKPQTAVWRRFVKRPMDFGAIREPGPSFDPNDTIPG